MTKTIVRPLAFAAILAALALPASAQWGPEEEKNCFLRGHKGTVTLSGQINDAQGDSSKLEQYEEIPEGVLVPCAAYSWSNEKYFFDAKTIDIGYDDQFLGGVFGKKGGFLLGLSWDQNPNWQSNTARTPYSSTSSGVLTVPDSMRLALQNVYLPWVAPTSSNPVGIGSAPANPTVPGYYAVQDFVNLGLPTFDLRYVRKTGRASFEIPVGKSLVLNASYAREMRDGNKNTTFAGGPDYEVATPIDFTTDNFHFGGDYAKGRFFLGASVDVSQFKNNVPFVEVDNPERLEMFNPTNGAAVVNDAEFFRLWMYPDNDAWQADFTGGFTLAKRHKITASISTGNMSMDMPLQYNISTNPNLQTSATTPTAGYTLVPPYSNITAEYDTFMGNLKFTGDPLNWLGYMAYWRKFELDDKTQDYSFTSFARGDTSASYKPEGIARQPQGWSIETWRAEAHVTPIAGLRLAASYGQDKRSYDIREYADVTDNVFTLSGDYSHRLFSAHLKWDTLDRNPGDSNEQAVPPEWDGATQTDISRRNRHILSGFVTLTPTAKWAITFNGAKTSNEFAESVTGLLDQSFDMFGVDLTYAASDKLSVFAGYVYEKYFFEMSAAYIAKNSPFDPANQWNNDTTDNVDTFRAGLDWVLVPDKWTLNATLDYTKPRSDSLYNFALPGTPIGGLNEANGIFPANVPPIPGTTPFAYDRFPAVSKTFTMAKIRLAYNITKNFTASVMYWKQKYDNEDWQTGSVMKPQTDFLQPYMGRTDPGANRWFFLGATIPSYDANIFRASVSYTF